MARFHSLCASLITSPATPAPVPDPRLQPLAAKELWPNFSHARLLLGASESFSQRTFSFDLGREGFPMTERAGSGSSAGFGAPFLSAFDARLSRLGLAWGGGCAGVAEAVQLAVPLILRFVPGSRARPLGVALGTLERWAAGPRRSLERKVSWHKFRGGGRSRCCPGVEGGEASRHRLVSSP